MAVVTLAPSFSRKKLPFQAVWRHKTGVGNSALNSNFPGLPHGLDGLLARLREALPELRQRYGVATLGVFGSYVRGEQGPDSDLDVLVEFNSAPTLFQFVEVEDFLSQQLGVGVDLVMKKALKPRLGQRILTEALFV